MNASVEPPMTWSSGPSLRSAESVPRRIDSGISSARTIPDRIAVLRTRVEMSSETGSPDGIERPRSPWTTPPSQST